MYHDNACVIAHTLQMKRLPPPTTTTAIAAAATTTAATATRWQSVKDFKIWRYANPRFLLPVSVLPNLKKCLSNH
jgi:hypothetical protein